MEEKKPKYVYYHNKKSGTTYVIENQPFWSKDRKRSEAKRKYIGTLCKETGEIILSKGRNRKPSTNVPLQHSENTELPSITASRCFYGATYLFDEIGKKLGIIDDLKYCLPDKYKQVLSMVKNQVCLTTIELLQAIFQTQRQ